VRTQTPKTALSSHTLQEAQSNEIIGTSMSRTGRALVGGTCLT
jgi:hypothetical protein